MIQRCHDTHATSFRYYGAKGITVCSRWQGSSGFQNFRNDCGERPQGKTLDRYPNPNGNYEPGNVRWASPIEQHRNQRNNKLNLGAAREIRRLHAEGHGLSEIARMFGVSPQLAYQVLRGRIWKETI